MSKIREEGVVDPFSVLIDLENGTMPEPGNRITRKASDMRGYYADGKALEELITSGNDPLHYEVLERPVPQARGHLMYCISRLMPGRVGEELFMTKGHYHSVKETAEIYLCLGGEGYMAMKTAGGAWAVERMERGRMVYVPPTWAHRSINTGREILSSFCVYPGEAGHNYGDIEKEGFPKRIFMKGGRIVME
jgi:glucose-6-phosphate isomerase